MRLLANHAVVDRKSFASLMLRWPLCFVVLLALTGVLAQAGDNGTDIGTDQRSSSIPPGDPSSTAFSSMSTPISSSSTTVTPSTTEVKSRSFSSAQPSTGTCQSRTVNYITHRLPQKCAKTGWVDSTATTEAGPKQEILDVQPTSSGGSNATTTTSTEVPSQQSTTAESGGNNLGHDTDPSIADKQSSETSSITASESSSSASSSPSASSEPDSDPDAILDSSKFLSFDEWKKQKLADAGQSADTLSQGPSTRQAPRRRPDFNNALEGLGDEGEIDFDFGDFGHQGAGGWAGTKNPSVGRRSKDEQRDAAISAHTPNTDAGKTCKERFNYASFDCASSALKANPEAKSLPSILVENKDSYMLNECSAPNKFFIVELCYEILVDTVVLANYEFFSSIFRRFRVSVSDRYPVKMDRWRELGVFEARNTRDIQAFWVREPQIWAKYLRIEILDHYGSEYYCPISLLRVHGTTMFEEYRADEEAARLDSAGEENSVIQTVDDGSVRVVQQDDEPIYSSEARADEKSSLPSDDNSTGSSELSSQTSETSTERQTEPASSASTELVPSSSAVEDSSSLANVSMPMNTADDVFTTNITESTGRSSDSLSPSQNPSVSISVSNDKKHTSDSTKNTPTSERQTASSGTSVTSSTTQSTSDSKQSASDTSSTLSDSSTATASTTSSAPSQQQPSSVPKDPSQSSQSSQPSQAMGHRPSPSPATQESFFKSMNKRLQSLESNTTLSLQYIESQSRSLREALSSANQRQRNTTATFLAALNESLFADQRALRADYARLWDGTVLEIESLREDLESITNRLRLLAEEIVWQKRIVWFQAVLVTVCLCLVMFGRGNGAPAIFTTSGSLSASASRSRLFRSRSARPFGRGAWDTSPSPLSSPGAATPHESTPRRRVRTVSPASMHELHGGAATSGDGKSDNDGMGEMERLHPGRPFTVMNELDTDDASGSGQEGEHFEHDPGVETGGDMGEDRVDENTTPAKSKKRKKRGRKGKGQQHGALPSPSPTPEPGYRSASRTPDPPNAPVGYRLEGVRTLPSTPEARRR